MEGEGLGRVEGGFSCLCTATNALILPFVTAKDTGIYLPSPHSSDIASIPSVRSLLAVNHMSSQHDCTLSGCGQTGTHLSSACMYGGSRGFCIRTSRNLEPTCVLMYEVHDRATARGSFPSGMQAIKELCLAGQVVNTAPDSAASPSRRFPGAEERMSAASILPASSVRSSGCRTRSSSP